MVIKTTLQMGRCINDIRWSGDSKRIIVVGDGSTEYGRIFNYDATNSVYKLEGITKCILSCDWNTKKNNRIVVADEDKTVSFYKGIPFSKQLYTMKHTRYPNVVRFSPDGASYVTVGSDSRVNLYNGDSGEFVRELIDDDNKHTGSIFGCAWSATSTQIVTSSADTSVKVWDAETGKVQKSWAVCNRTGVHDDQQIGAFWTPKTQKIASISLSGTLSFFTTAKDNAVATVYGHSSSVRACLLCRKRNLLFTTDADGHLFQWDCETGEAKIVVFEKPLPTACNVMACNPDQSTVYLGCLDGTIHRLQVGTIKLEQLPVSVSGTTFTSLSHGNSKPLLVYTTTKGTVGIVVDDAVVATAQVKEVTWSCCNADDSALYITSGSGTTVIQFTIDAASYALHRCVESEKLYCKHTGLVTVHQSSVASIEHNDVVVHDSTLKNVKAFGWSYHTSRITSLHWSPQGKSLLTSSLDKQIILWVDCVNFKPVNRICVAFTSEVVFADFITEDTVVAVGSDGFVKKIRFLQPV
uniref:Actin-interacting protein 1 n=1 Tax=Lygus hesperus TaxID=30085 RepID=A0A0A9W1W3_LYGHE